MTPGNFAIGGGWRSARAKYYLGPEPDGFQLREGALVVTMTDLSKNADTLGYPALVPPGGPFLHNQRIGLVEVTQPMRLDLKFLFYVLRGCNCRHQVLASATGSTVRHTSPSRILDYEFLAPDVGEQRAIAEVLGVLDDKIDANARLRTLLDECWMAHATRALHGDESSMETVLLTSLASFVNGRAFTKGATGTGRIVIRIAELNSGPSGSTVYNDIDVPEQHLARPGDLLFAWSGSLTVQRWFRTEATINQHIFKVIPAAGVPTWLVHVHLLHLLDDFRAIAANKATTMGHIQRRHLEVPVPALHGDALADADAVCAPLWNRALAAERETLALEAVREVLLPRLLSGQLRVRDLELLAGEAV